MMNLSCYKPGKGQGCGSRCHVRQHDRVSRHHLTSKPAMREHRPHRRIERADGIKGA